MNIKKWDGHTHSQFCPHGSREKTSLMVEKAIRLGFEYYSITEHAPLPPELLEYPSSPQDTGILSQEVEDYFLHILDLKKLMERR